MKFKYLFALVLLSTILFSLGTAVAGENINLNASLDNTYLSIDDQCSISGSDVAGSENLLSADGDLNEKTENQNNNLIGESPSNSSSDDEVDLSVDMELGDIQKHTFGINNISFDVPFIVTVTATNGTAKNVKVFHNISEDFEYVSHDETIGTYDPKSEIWDIGDLNSTAKATLTILTKINTKGTFVITVNATTDSNDTDLSNNDLKLNVQVSSRITSNTTRTSADQGPRHSNRYNSNPGGVVQRDHGENQQANENQNQNVNGGGSSGSGSGSEQNNGGSSGSGSEQNNGGSSGSGSEQNNGGSSGSGSGSEQNNGGSSGSGSGSQQNGGSSTDTGNNQKQNGDSGSQDTGSSSDSGNNNALKVINSNVIAKTTESITNTISDIGNTITDLFNPNSRSEDKDSNSSLSVVKAIAVDNYMQIPILIFALFLVALTGILAVDKIKS